MDKTSISIIKEIMQFVFAIPARGILLVRAKRGAVTQITQPLIK